MALSMTAGKPGKLFRSGIKLLLFYTVSLLLVGVILIQVRDLLWTGYDRDTPGPFGQEALSHAAKGARDVYADALGPSRVLQYSPKLPLHADTPEDADEEAVSVADQMRDVNFDSSDCDHGEASGSRVFILASMRTGSSFLGEIFAQRKDFFYLFEPGKYLAHHIEAKNLSRRVLITRYLELIEDVYRCDFSDSQVLLQGLANETILGKKRFAPALLYSKGCYREVVNHVRKNRIVCDNPFPESAITEICKARPHVGIKAIRIPDINLLLHLMRQGRTNLKVIHIVRDPRGMVVSRLRVYKKDRLPEGSLYNVSHITETVRYYVQRYCLSWATNIEIGKYIPWVSSNYKLVRYEDLARDPVQHTRDIYSFVGLGSRIPQSVERWLRNNTGMSVNQSESRPYSTSRNSRETFEAWRKSVRYDFVNYIQNIGDCAKLMTLAGYAKVPNEEALRDPRKSFVRSLPDYNLKKYEYL